MKEKDEKLVSTELTDKKYSYDEVRRIAEKNERKVSFNKYYMMDIKNYFCRNFRHLVYKFNKPVLYMNTVMMDLFNQVTLKKNDDGNTIYYFSGLEDKFIKAYVEPSISENKNNGELVIYDTDDVENTATIVNYDIKRLFEKDNRKAKFELYIEVDIDEQTKKVSKYSCEDGTVDGIWKHIKNIAYDIPDWAPEEIKNTEECSE